MVDKKERVAIARVCASWRCHGAGLIHLVQGEAAPRFRPMRETDVLDLCRDLTAEGVTFWLMGGWGVDALLGHQTRPHHDVDLLVEVSSLERFRQRLEALGFAFAYLWDGESRSIHDDAWEGDAEQPTAFVHRHADGTFMSSVSHGMER